MVSGLLGTGVKLIYCNVIHFRLPVGVPAPPWGSWSFLPTKNSIWHLHCILHARPQADRMRTKFRCESAFSCRSHRCCLWLIFRPKDLLLMMASVISLTRPSRSRTVNNTAWCVSDMILLYIFESASFTFHPWCIPVFVYVSFILRM